MDKQKVTFKVGDLVEIKASPMKRYTGPKMGLIVGSLNERAFKIWCTDGTFTSKLDMHLKLVNRV